MNSCKLTDFIKSLEPWLSADYIRRVQIHGDRAFKIFFTDGVISGYQIDDCSKSQFENIIKKLKNNKVPVEKQVDN